VAEPTNAERLRSSTRQLARNEVQRKLKLTANDSAVLKSIESAAREYLADDDDERVAARNRRALDDAMAAVVDAVDRLRAAVDTARSLGSHILVNHSLREATTVLDRTGRLRKPDPLSEWTPVTLAVAQFWMDLNGGHGRCRVCDARLTNDACTACGAEPVFAARPFGPNQGHFWWRATKARPRDLALVIVLADALPIAWWRLQSRKCSEPSDAIGRIAGDVRQQVLSSRKALRTERLRHVHRERQ